MAPGRGSARIGALRRTVKRTPMDHRDSEADDRRSEPRAPLPRGRSGLWFRFEPERRLGEVLLDHGSVSKRRLSQALVAQEFSQKPLGEILLEMKAVEPEDLERAIHAQQESTRMDRTAPTSPPPDMESR